MSWDDYLTKARAKNLKVFAADKIEITPASLESLMKHAYDAGYRSGYRDAAPKPAPKGSGEQLFDELFGDVLNKKY